MTLRILTFSVLLLASASGCSSGEDARQPNRESEGATTPAELARGDTTVVSGILIDSHCHADDPANIGADHDRPQGHVPGCAAICAREGFPVGILTANDANEPAVWVLVTSPAVLADYMAETVRVTGEIRSKGVLIPHRVELRQGESWTYIL